MKAKKFLSILLSIVMVLSMLTMGAMAADVPDGDPGAGGPGGPGGPGEGGGTKTIAAPHYECQVIEDVTSVTDIVTVLSIHSNEDHQLAKIVVGATVNGVEVEGLLTMTKNGVEVPVAEGTYTAEDKVVITVTDYLQTEDEDGNLVALGSWANISALPYRTALFVKDGEIVEDLSVLSAISDGDYDDDGADGFELTSKSDSFSAIIVLDSDYKITEAYIKMDTESDGTDANDFAGYGAAIAVYGDSVVEIEDSTIEATGVAKGATYVDDGADLIVRNSKLIANGGTVYPEYKSTANQEYMINPPWVLGISGSSRTTNVMGDYTTGTYVNTEFYADGWGAVSIDSGYWMHLTVINCDVKMGGSGYGAYNIGDGTWEDWYGTTFDVDTYAIIMTGATATLQGVEEGQEIEVRKIVEDTDASNRSLSTKTGELVTTETATEDAETVINSKNFGFMFHHNAFDGWNVLYLNDGTVVNTENATFLVKKVNAEINVDKAEINTENGVILQMMDNDDDGVGVDNDPFYGMPTFKDSYNEPEGWSSNWENTGISNYNWQTDFNATNADLVGDLYNGTGWYGSNGGMTLNVTLGEGANLTGVISSTEIMHGDVIDGEIVQYNNFTYRYDSFDMDTATAAASKLGHVVNQPYYNGVNPVNVTLTDDAVWTVTGSSIVNDLTADSAAITAEAPVTVTVYGTLTLDGEEVTENTTVGNVTYVVTEESEPDIKVPEFNDVDQDAWYAESVNWAVAKGITVGTGSNEFSPAQDCTKAEILTMLWRANGKQAAAVSFPDDVGRDYQDAIDWAYDQRIIGADFDPFADCTRADAVMYIWLANGRPEAESSSFNDVAANASCVRAVNWAVANGVTTGTGGGNFSPNETCTRSQIVTFLYRAYVQPYEA